MLSLPVLMSIPSETALQTQQGVQPNIWAYCGTGRLTDKINHHSIPRNEIDEQSAKILIYITGKTPGL